MKYEFKGTKEKWYPVNFGGFWSIHDDDFYDSTDIFNEEECSEAKENAILASKALEMFEMLKECLSYFECQNEDVQAVDKLKQIKQLLKEATEL